MKFKNKKKLDESMDRRWNRLVKNIRSFLELGSTRCMLCLIGMRSRS